MATVTVMSPGEAERNRRPQIGPVLTGIGRCPHCGVANPALSKLWGASLVPPNGGPQRFWAAYWCTSCGGVVLAKGFDGQSENSATMDALFPASKEAHEDIPEPARKFLQQAIESKHAPDAAAMVAGSAVDAMLKKLGYKEGSLYDRIDKAVAEHNLTQSMGDWAHEVRLGSNRPRHADADRPHVSPKEAAQSVEFAEALGYFLFVLTKRIERGTDAAKEASSKPDVSQ